MMKDVEYVKSVLAGDYATELPHEIPYPSLEDVIRATSFEYLAGTVEGDRPIGKANRDDREYLWFQHGDKPSYSHRFIVAVTLGKWPPRKFHIDHVNHDPSDNRPSNLRVVTPRDNARNRRQALLSELADLEAVSLQLEERRRVEEVLKQLAPKPQPMPAPEPTPEPVPMPKTAYKPGGVDPFQHLRPDGPIPQVTFTGRTKPAEHSDGTWHETNLGSWHLKFD